MDLKIGDRVSLKKDKGESLSKGSIGQVQKIDCSYKIYFSDVGYCLYFYSYEFDTWLEKLQTEKTKVNFQQDQKVRAKQDIKRITNSSNCWEILSAEEFPYHIREGSVGTVACITPNLLYIQFNADMSICTIENAELLLEPIEQMPEKLKVGQKVKNKQKVTCKTGQVFPGDIGIIDRVDSESYEAFYYILFGDRELCCHESILENYLELVTEMPEKKWSIGQRVKAKINHPNAKVKTGEQGIVCSSAEHRIEVQYKFLCVVYNPEEQEIYLEEVIEMNTPDEILLEEIVEMDPTSNLNETRDIVYKLAKGQFQSLAVYGEDVERLYELVLEMDEWLSNGGFFPEQWKGKITERAKEKKFRKVIEDNVIFLQNKNKVHWESHLEGDEPHMIVEIHSDDPSQQHKEAQQILGKRVRITIEEL